MLISLHLNAPAEEHADMVGIIRGERDRAVATYLDAGRRGDQPAASRALRMLAELTTRIDELLGGLDT